MESTHTLTVTGIITIIIQLAFLEGILFTDNAVVLGVRVSMLPNDEPVLHPKLFTF